MSEPRDMWLATGLAMISLAGFLVLRPQAAPPADPAAASLPAAATTTTAAAATTTEPLLPPVAESVSRVLTGAGNAEVVDPDQIDALPRSVVKVLVDRRAVLTLPEDAP